MAQNIPPYPQVYPDPRARGVSNASANRYTPESYQSPNPVSTPGYAQPPRARGPSLGEQQIPATSPIPMPQPNSYFPSQGGSPGQPQLSSSYPKTPPYQHTPQQQYQQPNVDRDGYMLPPEAPRRMSASSAHSRHSSHHSQHGRSRSRSDGSRRSRGSHSSRDQDHHRSRSSHSHHHDERRSHEREREGHHHHRRHHSDDEIKSVKRTKSHRPTWGDTVFSMFGVFKDYLGPRDKY